jgi:hypothetical protein
MASNIRTSDKKDDLEMEIEKEDQSNGMHTQKENTEKQSHLELLIDAEYYYWDIDSEEKIQLYERLMSVRKGILSHIELLSSSQFHLKEFSSVFGYDFFHKVVETKPFEVSQLKHWLDREEYENTTAYSNYSELFMHEIFHFCYLRKAYKKLNQKLNGNGQVQSAGSISNRKEESPVEKELEVEEQWVVSIDSSEEDDNQREQIESNLAHVYKKNFKMSSRRVVGKKEHIERNSTKKRNIKKTFV